MSSIRVLNAIAVQISPPEEENQKDWSYNIGALWPCDQPEVIAFTSKVDAKFHKSSKSHAKFQKPYPVNSFPFKLEGHLNGNYTFEVFVTDFIQNKLITSAKQSRASNGAILVFTHYQLLNEKEGNNTKVFERILILMLKNTDALRFKENLQLNPVDVIDLDKFLQGARVDLMRFMSEDEDELDKNNLCFIRGTGDVRKYFTSSIGADEVISNKTSSEQCIKALELFTHQPDFSRPLREKIESKVQELFNNCKKGESITLEKIQIQIDSIIPANLAQYKNTFVDFVNENGFEVNEEFEVLPSDKKQLEWIDFETSIAKLSIKKHHVGLPGSQREIIFDSETNQVTLVQTIVDPIVIERLKELTNE
ncbi:TPA: nucleoid-associated protein [Providencia rettgeri]|nr:nucleoid-associated protein [Providencia rettgeri]